MKTLTLGVFMSGLTVSCFCQVVQEPNTFFKESIGLANDQIAEIRQGKAVTKVLNTKTPSEVVVFGAVYINGSIESYLKAASNLNGLRGSPNYLGLRQLSTPPKLEDFEGFVLEEDDVKDLKNCKPGKCELQLPAASMVRVPEASELVRARHRSPGERFGAKNGLAVRAEPSEGRERRPGQLLR